MKTPYTFIVLRYVHDVVTGEFANVGVVVFAPKARFLAAEFNESYRRLSALFLKIDHAHYRNTVRYLKAKFTEMATEMQEGLLVDNVSLESLVRKVLPQDDSSLQWSAAGGGLSADLPGAVQEIYGRMVERYIPKEEASRRDDEEIARPFKTRLREKANYLQRKIIAGKDYEYPFEYAWRNGFWHTYEPVSFDLMEGSSILEKANKWLGRSTALNDATEEFKIHFLIGEPKSGENQKAFQKALSLMKRIPIQMELVLESDIESFADRVFIEMLEHSESEKRTEAA